MLELEGVEKRFGKTIALRNLYFSAKAGEAVALLGANGAGKSTTVKIVATLLRPDRGLVSIAGEDAVRHPAAGRSRLGAALQEIGLPPRQTPRRLLDLHARLHGYSASAARTRSRQLLDSLLLGRFADLPVSQLSGGVRRRADIALAMVHRPSLLVLDEPTAALDLDAKHAVWQAVEEHRLSGAAVLFTTHDLREAEEIANRVAILANGEVIDHSEPSELKRRFGGHIATLGFRSELEARTALAVLPKAKLDEAASLRVALGCSKEMLEVLRLLDSNSLPPTSLTLREPSFDAAYAEVVSRASGKRGESG
jgi:ABC-type multidrug transport system ATPase subunit